MTETLGLIILIALVALIVFGVAISITKSKFFEKGYIAGAEETKRCKTIPNTVWDVNGIVHEGLAPTTGIHIYERQKPFTDLKSIVPEFGIDIKYNPNEKPNLREFNIGIRSMYNLDPIKITPNGVSDGFHTFDELYYYRMLYNSNAVNLLAFLKSKNIKEFADFDVIKSKKHFGGEPCYGGGWFIVVIKTPWGQISNHYKLKYWDMFNCRPAKTSWKWDGHSMKESTDRMIKLNKYIGSVLPKLNI